jgi:hypothetical protein
MKHLKKFNEALEPELVNAVKYLKANKKEDLNIRRNQYNHIKKVITDNYEKSDKDIAKILGLTLTQYEDKLDDLYLADLKDDILLSKEVDKDEDLNIPRNEIKHISNAIIKNYDKSYPEIAKLLGISPRALFRKLKEYDLEDLKSQVKLRGGKGWNHPYNKIDINEN